MFAISASRQYVTPEGFTKVVQAPTFYLEPAVQGILSETHAAAIGLEVVSGQYGSTNPADWLSAGLVRATVGDVTFCVSAVQV